MNGKAVTNMTVSYNVALVTVDNLPNNIKLISEIFNSMAEEKINVDMISQTPPYKGSTSLSFSLPSDNLVKALGALNKFKKDVSSLQIEVDASNTKISIYGDEMRNLPGVAARLFTVLAGEGIEIKLVTTSEVDISCLIYEKDVDRAIEATKKEFGI